MEVCTSSIPLLMLEMVDIQFCNCDIILPPAYVDEKVHKIDLIRQAVREDPCFTWEPLPLSEGAERRYVLCRSARGAAAANKRINNPVGLLLSSDSIPQHVWPAASPMCAWVGKHKKLFEGKTILELGSGTGMVGLTVAQFAKRVILTDCSVISLTLLMESVAHNKMTNCTIAFLQWGKEEQIQYIKEKCKILSFDIVIGSDVFYFNSSLKSGLATAQVALLPRRKDGALFICGSVARSERMECDLDEVPIHEGFVVKDEEVADAFRLYCWELRGDA